MHQDQAKAAPLQVAEREVLYLQQFHLGQVYSENSSQLAVLRQVNSRTNRICPDLQMVFIPTANGPLAGAGRAGGGPGAGGAPPGPVEGLAVDRQRRGAPLHR
jgi:hypothetical protein